MVFFLKTTLNSGGFVDIAAQVSSEGTFYYLISFLKWKRRNEMEDRGGSDGERGRAKGARCELKCHQAIKIQHSN